MAMDRRTFIKVSLGASGLALLAQTGCSTDSGKAAQPSAPASSAPTGSLAPSRSSDALPAPDDSGIEHVVVVMMENRSFDHLLGWLPGADGRQGGLRYANPSGIEKPTFHQKQLNGCGFVDPDHSYAGGRIQYNSGRMDGFLTDRDNDAFAISYYAEADRAFLSPLARRFTSCDNYFASILGPTFPNRMFQHAAQADRLDDAITVSTLPTIWDRLNTPEGPTGRYYYSDFPILGLWGDKYTVISSKLAQFFRAAASGALPNVSFVDPSFLVASNGTSNDDHPLSDLRAGDAFLSQVVHAVMTGPAWDKTVLVLNYDEWGGFFDHVPPRRVTAGVPIGADPANGVDKDLDADGQVLTGFRVPCIVVSPFTRTDYATATSPGHAAPVAKGFFDHTSVLKLIEWRWQLEPLSRRDASTRAADPGNLAAVLNFEAPDVSVPKLPLLAAFTPTSCATSSAQAAVTAAVDGWRVAPQPA
jgi:phospholipase C